MGFSCMETCMGKAMAAMAQLPECGKWYVAHRFDNQWVVMADKRLCKTLPFAFPNVTFCFAKRYLSQSQTSRFAKRYFLQCLSRNC